MKRNGCRPEILLGKGLGDVRFGMGVREVEDILGRAPEADYYDDGGERTIALRYNGLSMFFHQSDDFRLSVIEVDQSFECCLFGSQLFPSNRDEVLNLLRREFFGNELGRLEESRDEDLDEASLTVHSLWVTFYFDLSGLLQEVNWSVFVDQNDEVAWP